MDLRNLESSFEKKLVGLVPSSLYHISKYPVSYHCRRRFLNSFYIYVHDGQWIDTNIWIDLFPVRLQIFMKNLAEIDPGASGEKSFEMCIHVTLKKGKGQALTKLIHFYVLVDKVYLPNMVHQPSIVLKK